MSFKLRKWYFDVLTEDLDYFFVYFATVRVGKILFPSLTAHVACGVGAQIHTSSLPAGHIGEATGGGPYVRIILPQGGIHVEPGRCTLEFSSAQASANLQYVSTGHHDFQGVGIEAPLRSSIRWIPLGLKHAVSGWLNVGGIRIRVDRADGYADYLESSCLPPMVPVRTLHWGRLHHADLDFVFIHAATSGGTRSWSRLEGVEAGRRFDAGMCTLSTSMGRNTPGIDPTARYDYLLRTDSKLGCARVSVRHAVPVQDGSFIDQQTIASPLVRAGVKLMTRNPRSTKYLSFGDVVLEQEGRRIKYDHVPLIDECACL